MAHFALCSRDSMASAIPPAPNMADSPRLIKSSDPKKTPHHNRARKARKFIPLDLNTIDSQPKAAEDDITPADQHPPASHKPRSRARNKKPPRPSSHRSKHITFTPVDSVPPPQNRDNVAKKARRHRKTRPQGKLLNKVKVEDMTAVPQGAYLPPHMRKRATLQTKPETDVKLGDSLCVGSPPASVKSQLAKPVQEHVPAEESTTPDTAPPSPPTTVEEPPVRPVAYDGWDAPLPQQPKNVEEPSVPPVVRDGWGIPLPQQPSAPPKRNSNPRWPRQNNTSPRPKPTRAPKERYAWPKSRDIPRYLPGGSESDGGVVFPSNSDGDDAYDVKKLMDWNGDWLPPPEDWAARKGFTDRHFTNVIDKWANEHSRQCLKAIDISSPVFSSGDRHGEYIAKDIVPRYWLPEKVDNDSMRTFWEDLPHRAPFALDGVDITEDPPYWERWDNEHPQHCFMGALPIPEAKIDKEDPANELGHPLALLCAAERLAKILKKRAIDAHRTFVKQNRPVLPCTELEKQIQSRQLRPRANIYLRPVQPADVPGIMSIYNHYITDSLHADELEVLTEAEIRCRINNITSAGLPFIVAVAKRNQPKMCKGYVVETIVGYAQLEDHVSQSSMYRYTFELNLYVHPGYIRQGVGKCLLDRLMYFANTSYSMRGGYEWVNDFEYLKSGKGRVVKTILTNLHYERGEEVDWANSYLGDFGFVRAGRFSQVGYKHGKVVDKVMFQTQTGEVIDPNSIPTLQA